MVAGIPRLAKKFPLSLSAIQVFSATGWMQHILADAARIYLALGGSPGLHWPIGKPPHEILEDLLTKCQALLNGSLTKATGVGAKQTFWVSSHLSYDKATSSFYLWVSSEYYFYITMEQFVNLWKKDRRFYLFARDMFRALLRCPCLPFTSMDNVFEMFYEMLSGEDPDYYKDREKALARFKAYLAIGDPREPTFSDIVRKQRERYAALKDFFTSKQRKWAETGFRLFKKAGEVSNTDTSVFAPSDVYDDEQTPMECALCLLYDADSDGESWEQWTNDYYGNYGPAMAAFHLRDKRDAQAVKQFIELLYLGQWFFYESMEIA